ncbi:MAG: M23 family metallopeptidase [Thermodesulfobacteriota bacterium]|nr:M23 family metallopeptidase [Thermodesulfobacteriota bacterium]
MTKKKRDVRFWLCWLLTLSLHVFLLSGTVYPKQKEGSLGISWYPKYVKQGDTFIVTVHDTKGLRLLSGEFKKRPLLFYKIKEGKSFRALFGVDLAAAPGKYQLKISAKDSYDRDIKASRSIDIHKRDFITQRLTLPRKMVELDKKTQNRVLKEGERIKDLWTDGKKERLWHGEFIMPIDGEVISPFGARRIMNDVPKNPHSGVDLRAGLGAKIRCSNTGIVALVDNLYFSGKSVFIDHGQGLYSMYFHLSQVNIKLGQRIEKGEVLGLAGSTGRATGPHLHWGVRLNKARVDPLSLLRLGVELED